MKQSAGQCACNERREVCLTGCDWLGRDLVNRVDCSYSQWRTIERLFLTCSAMLILLGRNKLDGKKAKKSINICGPFESWRRNCIVGLSIVEQHCIKFLSPTKLANYFDGMVFAEIENAVPWKIDNQFDNSCR